MSGSKRRRCCSCGGGRRTAKRGAPGGPEVPVLWDVEMDEWRLVVPEFAPLPSPVAFIDGVQRIELRVLTDNDGARVFGAFASLGGGAGVAAEGGAGPPPGRSARRPP